MEIKLKKSLRLGGKGYKVQKSKGNNSGTNKHKKNTKNKRTILGTAVKILNYSPTERFCEFTGIKLPRNGMAWYHDGKYFKDLGAAEKYEHVK